MKGLGIKHRGKMNPADMTPPVLAKKRGGAVMKKHMKKHEKKMLGKADGGPAMKRMDRMPRKVPGPMGATNSAGMTPSKPLSKASKISGGDKMGATKGSNMKRGGRATGKKPAEHFIQGMHLKKGAFTAQAKRAGKSVHELAEEKKDASGKTGKRARLALTFEKMRKK